MRPLHHQAIRLSSFFVMMLIAVQSLGQTLAVGDQAPPLTQGDYVKGEPVSTFEPGKVYVLEFWATWCAPCIEFMPHLTKLQKQYGEDKVVVIAQNIMEFDESAVAGFVEEMGDKMDFRVALDNKSEVQTGAMQTAYMDAAGLQVIPSTFVIDQEGKVAWFGHPMDLDQPLAEIVAGTFDAQAAAEIQQAKRAFQMAIQTAVMPFLAEARLQDAAGALEAMIDEHPTFRGDIHVLLFSLYAQIGDMTQSYAAFAEAIPALVDRPETLNEVAKAIAISPDFEGRRNLGLAQTAAESAVATTDRKEAAYLATLARIYHLQGDRDQAIAIQKEAVLQAQDQDKNLQEAVLAEYAG